MSPLGAQLVLSSPSSNWTKIILVAIFALGLVLVILVPFVWDLAASHKTWRNAVDKDPAALKSLGRPAGMQGLARATMAFAVIVVIGFALGYILVEQPFGTDKTIAGNIVVALTTTLAAITAFYFGSKMATDTRNKPPGDDTPPS
jgi:ABC-type Fe3+ transport system permease subunit